MNALLLRTLTADAPLSRVLHSSMDVMFAIVFILHRKDVAVMASTDFVHRVMVALRRVNLGVEGSESHLLHGGV